MVYIPLNWKTKTVSESVWQMDQESNLAKWKHEVEPKCLTLLLIHLYILVLPSDSLLSLPHRDNHPRRLWRYYHTDRQEGREVHAGRTIPGTCVNCASNHLPRVNVLAALWVLPSSGWKTTVWSGSGRGLWMERRLSLKRYVGHIGNWSKQGLRTTYPDHG